jgi:hypothetical protein
MRWAGAAIGVACFALASGARAQRRECAAIEGGSPALAALDAEARFDFVRRVMHDQGSRATTWRWSWTGIGLGLATGQYALIPIVAQDKRLEQVYLGTASLFIPLSTTVFPLRIRDYDDVLVRAAADAEGSEGHMLPCLVLDHAEEMLIQAANDEANLTNVFHQVTSLVLDAGYAAIIAIAFRDAAGTVINGVGSVAVTELQIFTTPTGAVKALERYRRGDLSAPPGEPRVAWTMAPLGIAPGVSLVARF